MPYITETGINTGSFIQTTNIWDTEAIASVNVNSQEFKGLLIALYQDIGNIAIVLNNKVSGYYVDQEFVSGKLYSNPNSSNPENLVPGFTKSFMFGALGPGITAQNHNIAVNANTRWISIVGAATDNVGLVGYPITFAGAAGNNIEVTMSATQIIINNASGIVFSSAYVTVEYVKY